MDLPPAQSFGPIRRIGGATGWYYGNRLWRLRGAIDLFLGGVGMRRGRRNVESLRVGDTVDCWRVEAFEPDRRLLLRGEMKLAGRAWLEFAVEPTPTGSLHPADGHLRAGRLAGPRLLVPGLPPPSALVPWNATRHRERRSGTFATRSRGDIAGEGPATGDAGCSFWSSVSVRQASGRP